MTSTLSWGQSSMVMALIHATRWPSTSQFPGTALLRSGCVLWGWRGTGWSTSGSYGTRWQYTSNLELVQILNHQACGSSIDRFDGSKIAPAKTCKKLFQLTGSLMGKLRVFPLPSVYPTPQVLQLFSDYASFYTYFILRHVIFITSHLLYVTVKPTFFWTGKQHSWTKKDKLFHNTSHFWSFLTVKYRFVAWQSGLPRKFADCVSLS